MKNETRVTHQPRVEMPEGNIPLVGPIYQSVKFTMPSLEATKNVLKTHNGYLYSRTGNPTVRQLELLLAEIQEREDAIVLGSGVAAISTALISLLKAQDHIVMFWESYKPTRFIVRSILAKFGVRHTILHVADLKKLEETVAKEKSKMVIFETPTNPMLRIADIEKITSIAKKHGALSVLDNTFAGVHQHGKYPVDVFIHSLTKYVCGHGDVLGGAVIADKEIIKSISPYASSLGAVMDAHAAYLVSRGMKTYFVRRKAHCENAQAIAEWLSSHPKVTNLRYPGLTAHPDHELARKQMKDFGAMISFDIKGSSDQTGQFLDELHLFHQAASLGSTDSLATPVRLFFAPDLSDEEAKNAGITQNSIRLSVGIEDVGDLIEDLNNALAQCTSN